MQSKVDAIFRQELTDLTGQLAEFENKVEPLGLPEDDGLFHELVGIVQGTLAVCRDLENATTGDENLKKATQERFREVTDPWCRQSWIINRARTKPRGFPGDYQMLMAIYDGVPIARGLGGYLDRACLQMTLGKAVDARLRDARAFLDREFASRTGDIHVLNVASGPGREYRMGLGRNSSGNITVTCVDSDQGALEYIDRHVSLATPDNLKFNCCQYNAMRLRTGELIKKQFGAQDIIYSVGLADYIPDRLLVPMLSGWREALKPGGCVYVAFKDQHRYDKVEYQWLMDWHFLQRDENDFVRLLSEAGYHHRDLEVSRDSTGVIVNYLSRQKAPLPSHAQSQPQPAFVQRMNQVDATKAR